MPIGRTCQQPTSTVSDVRRSQRTRNTSIKSRDAQDPVPILVTGLVLSANRFIYVRADEGWTGGGRWLWSTGIEFVPAEAPYGPEAAIRTMR